MDKEKITQLEKLLARELSVDEIERLRRIKDTLKISDNDALWDIIVALEYQRTFYDEMPGKISAAAADIFNQLASGAEKEISLAQGRLADSVVEHAKKLSTRIDIASWLILGMVTLVVLLVYGSLLLWAGYCIGTGQTHPPAFLLRMPVGIIIGGLFVAGGLFLGASAAKDYSEGLVGWQKRMLAALGCLLPGGVIFSLTVY